MRHTHLTGIILFGIASIVVLAACGSDADTNDLPAGQPGSNGDVGSSSGGFGETSSGGAASGGEASCAATAAETKRGTADIIFVIDNSGSMGAEMTQIRANVNAFAQKIGNVGIDYRVVVIARRASSPTDTGTRICVPEPLAGPNCGDKLPTFMHVPQFVTSDDSLVQILTTYDQGTWSTILRPEATKVFIEVTDDESSMSAEDFDKALLAKAPAGIFGTAQARNYVFHSIISKPAGSTAPTTDQCATADGTSLEYQKLSILTKGIMDEVCKTDYSGVLDNIAKGIVERVGCELGYPTGEGADPDKIVVRLTENGTPKNLVLVTDASKCGSVADGWHYDDPQKPTKIVLCESTCAAANASSSVKVEALIGCKAPAPK